MNIGSGIGEAIVRAAIFIGVVMFALGALAVWAIPKVWGWLKPIIHAWTA